tara:strand:- start:850 stop:1098 length:249 start_codon:yes stop_codon:yes gene_type:complete
MAKWGAYLAAHANSPRCKMPLKNRGTTPPQKLAPDSISPNKAFKGTREQKKSRYGPNFAILDSTAPMAHRQIFPVFLRVAEN